MITIGLAGKPNAGKSTFFKASTLSDVDIGNYPFTTIDANKGITHVRTECPCLELDERCGNCQEGKRYVPVELIDVAGLVPDAHKGKGLGNQFLDELRRADVIIHVVDAAGATNAEGEPVEVGDHDPLEDVEFLKNELDMWIYGILEENWPKVIRRSKTPDFDVESELVDILAGVGPNQAEIRRTLRQVDPPGAPENWDETHLKEFARVVRETSKPIAIAANKADIAPRENVDRLLGLDELVVPTSAESELALRNGDANGFLKYDPGDTDFEIVGDLNPQQEKGLGTIRNLIEENDGTGVQSILNAVVYDLLDMITVYPVENESRWTDGSGNVLPDAFLLPEGSTPRDLAFEVHTDVGEGYLHAVDARTKQRISDEYELKEGDIIKIASTA